jgi:hypothetical protein
MVPTPFPPNFPDLFAHGRAATVSFSYCLGSRIEGPSWSRCIADMDGCAYPADSHSRIPTSQAPLTCSSTPSFTAYLALSIIGIFPIITSSFAGTFGAIGTAIGAVKAWLSFVPSPTSVAVPAGVAAGLQEAKNAAMAEVEFSEIAMGGGEGGAEAAAGAAADVAAAGGVGQAAPDSVISGYALVDSIPAASAGGLADVRDAALNEVDVGELMGMNSQPAGAEPVIVSTEPAPTSTEPALAGLQI